MCARVTTKTTTDGDGQQRHFSDLGLSDELLKAVSALGYEEPTPIQRESIPHLLAGKDLLGQAATGTGKTAAFALPLLEHLVSSTSRGVVAALVLVPTRELAMQVGEAVHKYGRGIGVRVLPIYGGQPIARQLHALARGVDVVVATPGRALDHIRRGTLKLQALRVLVLDEADEMLDMGFADDLDAILEATPPERQTVLFSATMPPRISGIVKRSLKDPVHIKIVREQPAPGEGPLVRQTAYVVPRAHKLAALGRVLDAEAPTAALIFCRTRTEVDVLSESLNARGYRAEALHGGMSQEQRDRVMGRLRSGSSDLLVATDVAARGLDIEQLTHVVNYDVPSAAEVYVHRIGRTGRAGRGGTALTFVEPREHRLLKNIQHLTKQQIHVAKVPTVADLRARRLELTRASLREAILANRSEDVRVIVDSLTSEFDVMEVALAAVKLAHEATRGDSDDDVEIPDIALRQERQERTRAPRGHRPESGMTRLYVSLGRSAGVRPHDLVGAIANEAGLAGRDIGAIEITDRFSLVEVPDGRVDDVIKAMKSATIKGKKATVRREKIERR